MTRRPGAFGEVMERLMRKSGLEQDPANVHDLAARSGLDGDELLRSMASPTAADLRPLNGLDTELDLSEDEKMNLARASTTARCDLERGDAPGGLGIGQYSREHPDAELAEGDGLMGSVRGLLQQVGVEELRHQLHEAEGVTCALRQMGGSLSPATSCILSGAHERARRALQRAEALTPQT